MNYKRKIKIRLGVYFGYFLIGIILIAASVLLQSDFLMSLGAVFALVAVVGTIKLLRLIRNPALMKQAEVLENDERNVYIYQRAKSISFTVLSFFAAAGIVISGIMKETVVMKTLSYFLSGAMIIYLVSYYVIKRKS